MLYLAHNPCPDLSESAPMSSSDEKASKSWSMAKAVALAKGIGYHSIVCAVWRWTQQTKQQRMTV